MIELCNITKIYPMGRKSKTVLRNLNACIKPGKNLGILGQNGAGKSTLLRLIGGAELPTSGTIHRSGRVSWPLGFSGGFNGSLTGRENLNFICRIYGVPIEPVAEFVAEFSELGEYMHMPINTYSSGMKGKLAFGLSMAIDFDFYLIDEATATGDASFKKKCQEEFNSRRERATLLVVSHSMSTIKKYCDIVSVLYEGDLHIFDDAEEAFALYKSLPALKY